MWSTASAIRLKAARRQLVDPKITEHHGRIVKTTGDGLLVEFASVVDAVRCAAEVQRGMIDREPEATDELRWPWEPTDRNTTHPPPDALRR